MSSLPTVKHHPLRLCAVLALFLGLFLPDLPAQSTPTGTLSGRVFNPLTGDYVRNAQVTIEGTMLSTTSGIGGQYRLPNVPAGSATVVVRFAGYAEARQAVMVTAGSTVRADLELARAESTSTGEDGTLILEAFVISEAAEGQAKSIMEQRNSFNLGQSVSSDIFGDVTEGNVGEFLKFLAGVELEYVEADTRGPRLGGFGSEYVGVSLDGVKAASADAFVTYGGGENAVAGGTNRSFSFEQVSINSIESIEISRITPANLDADAPAGTINMRTRRAFDRRGRLVTWSTGFGLNSEEFHFRKNAGPGDTPARQVKPNANFNYSDVYMDGRLGVLLGFTHSNLYNEQYRMEQLYFRRQATDADPRTQVLRALNTKDGPKWTERNTITATTDFKVNDNFVVGLALTYNTYEAQIFNRATNMQAANNNAAGVAFVVGDGVTSFGTNPNNLAPAAQRWIRPGGAYIVKRTNTITAIPKLEYTWDNLKAELTLSRSSSINKYGSLRTREWAGNAQRDYQNIQFEATRPSPSATQWTIRQTGGPDWGVLANSVGGNTITDDERYVFNEIDSAKLDFTYNLSARYPTVVFAGAKIQKATDQATRRSPMRNWVLNQGSIADYPSSFEYQPTGLGARFISLSGRGPQYVDREALGALFNRSPQLFTETFSVAQYYESMFSNTRDLTETVPAVYAMARTNFGKVQLQGGLRWEQTNVASEQFDPLSSSEVIAGGFPANLTSGLATTVPGLDYQFLSRPMVVRKSDYDRLFPSVSAKFLLAPRLLADIGYGTAIRRPQLSLLSSARTVNEVSEIINISNPGLLPEYSERVAAAFGYYFGGANNVSLTLTETRLDNQFIVGEFTVDEFGITDPEYQGYIVRTTTNGSIKQVIRSMEMSYRHNLRQLPPFLDSATVFATYTRTYSNTRFPGMSPHTATGGFDVGIKRVTFGLKGVWVDDAEWTGVIGRYREGNLKLDASLNVRLGKGISFFAQGRNITSVNHTVWEEVGGNVPVIWRQENYGVSYTFGIRGRF
jgi:iron complex outermembrane recepter protein